MKNIYQQRLAKLTQYHQHLLSKVNEEEGLGNGIFKRYANPILTAQHTPLHWRYDLNPETNPYLMERFGINATFNAGAILLDGKYLLVVRVEGADRKSFFAVAESYNGIDNFQFWDRPIKMPQTEKPDVNVYDMRLTQHEDGWIYGLFCTERKDPDAKPGDESSALAQCGIARTKDLKTWDRLADFQSPSPQQRNVVLHPEFIKDKYAFYTRPQDSFIEAGKGGGIGFALADDITKARVDHELVIEGKQYHTINEVKNGQGPAPIKTTKGWLHLAHGVRNTAAGLRYVLYVFVTALEDPTKVIHKPAGYFLAPEGEERIGDVSNVVFTNGWIHDKNDKVLIYYGSSDTRMHVASTTIDQLLDYAFNTAEDGLSAANSVERLNAIIDRNAQFRATQEVQSKAVF